MFSFNAVLSFRIGMASETGSLVITGRSESISDLFEESVSSENYHTVKSRGIGKHLFIGRLLTDPIKVCTLSVAR